MAKTGKPRSKRLGDLSELAIGIAIVLLVLFITSFVRVRADLTSEQRYTPVSYTHLRAHETVLDLVCRLLLEKKQEHFIVDNIHVCLSCNSHQV